MPWGVNLFGAGNTEEAQKDNAKDMVRDWNRRMKAEIRGIERGIRKIDLEEDKIKREIKAMAKKGADPQSLHMLAKSVVRSGKAKGRLYQVRANLTAASNEMVAQAASMRMADQMKTSTAIMQQVNMMVKVPELHDAMSEMRKEMMRAGLVDEMMDEGMEEMDGEEMEEEAEHEVDKVLDDLAIDAATRMAITRPAEAAAVQEPKVEVATAAASVAPARTAIAQ